MTRWYVCKLAVVLSVLSVLTVLTQASAQQPARPAAPPARDATAVEEYRIGPEDVLAISVWKSDAMSRVVPVRPDGMISLPLLSDIQAAGLTPAQLSDLIKRKLADYMPAPEVAVVVNDVRSFKVSVIGEVLKPARYDLKSRTTILDVLAMAGGFNQFAARTGVVIIRHDGNTKNRIKVNYNRVIAGEEENLALRPNDIVVVP